MKDTQNEQHQNNTEESTKLNNFSSISDLEKPLSSSSHKIDINKIHKKSSSSLQKIDLSIWKILKDSNLDSGPPTLMQLLDSKGSIPLDINSFGHFLNENNSNAYCLLQFYLDFVQLENKCCIMEKTFNKSPSFNSSNNNSNISGIIGETTTPTPGTPISVNLLLIMLHNIITKYIIRGAPNELILEIAYQTKLEKKSEYLQKHLDNPNQQETLTYLSETLKSLKKLKPYAFNELNRCYTDIYLEQILNTNLTTKTSIIMFSIGITLLLISFTIFFCLIFSETRQLLRLIIVILLYPGIILVQSSFLKFFFVYGFMQTYELMPNKLNKEKINNKFVLKYWYRRSVIMAVISVLILVATTAIFASVPSNRLQRNI